LDQDAYFALHAYLDRASARLGEHPDRDEVLAGLERSIGTKLARAGARSAPFTGAEMAAALKEVGKVDGPQLGPSLPDRDARSWRDDGEPLRDASPVWRDDGALRRDAASWPRPRRLYRLDDGKRLAGVCTGLAAFTSLDVGLIRALWVVAAVFTGFFLVFFAYIALMVLVPIARTSTEIAAAHGALRSA
jgi:phage shock protein PspC (stress-responsive transcriptional regulator)